MPTSTKTAKECCRDLGVDPELWWGRVNNYILDGYHEGVAEERQRTRDAEQAAARAGAEAGTLRVEVRRLCERVEELEALVAGRAA